MKFTQFLIETESLETGDDLEDYMHVVAPNFSHLGKVKKGLVLEKLYERVKPIIEKIPETSNIEGRDKSHDGVFSLGSIIRFDYKEDAKIHIYVSGKSAKFQSSFFIVCMIEGGGFLYDLHDDPASLHHVDKKLLPKEESKRGSATTSCFYFSKLKESIKHIYEECEKRLHDNS
jgi:hypothetical protein